jgi:site-specific DNA recombinase
MREAVALYARVSTLHQEQEATIDSQVAAIEAYASEHDLALSPELYFLDAAISGAQLVRPALDRLRDQAAAGAFGVLLCLCPDRLARRCAHQWVLLDELARAGVTVRFLQQPPVPDDPTGQLLLGIQGLFAEYERALITERLRRGKLYRLRQGQAVCPQPPYGYRYRCVAETPGGRWEVDAVEAAGVRRIYQWYTSAEPLSIQAIVERLNAPPALTPARGKRWTFSTVQGILTQSAYRGRAYYNRTRLCAETVGEARRRGRGTRQRPRREPRPVAEWIEVAVPVIVEESVWERAQERLRMNRQFAARNNQRHFYLLRSLLVCEQCGRTLVGRTAGGHVTYYCTNRGKNRDPEAAAHSVAIAASRVEPVVWEAVCQLLRHPRLLADAWQSEGEAPSPEEIDRLQARQRALERQWTRVIDAFQDGLIDKEELAQRKTRLDGERAELEQRQQQVMRLARRDQAKAQMLDDFEAFCRRIEQALDAPTPEAQQEVLRLLVDHVVVKKDEIVIRHIVPTDDDCRLKPGRR